MPISVGLFKFNKKVNSTIAPAQGAGTITAMINIKEASNLFSPTLVFTTDIFQSGDTIQNPMEYNYCYIPDFKRYYFIKQWSWLLGRWECRLEVDVLASFKREIGNSTMYVLRSASRADGSILDTKYPVKRQIAYRKNVLTPHVPVWNTNLHSASIDEGFYCVGIANNDLNALGSVAYYAFSVDAMRELMTMMYSSPSWLGVTDAGISTDLQKMLLNPLQYIVSCVWIPTGFSPSGGTGTNTVPYGWWSITLPSTTVYRITQGRLVLYKDWFFGLREHPQKTSDDLAWLNLAPYTMFSLNFPPFGMIPLDSLRLTDSDGIHCGIWIDVITGKATLRISRAVVENQSWVPREQFYETVAQLGVPMALAQMSVDLSSLGNSSQMIGGAALGAVTGAGAKKLAGKGATALGNALTRATSNQRVQDILANHPRLNNMVSSLQSSLAVTAAYDTGDSLLDTVKETASDVGNALIAAMGQCSSSGATGALGMLDYPPELIQYFQYVVDMDPVHNGYPLCEMTQINTLSGFILVGNADEFTANCMAVERQAVIQYLEGGFYYE